MLAVNLICVFSTRVTQWQWFVCFSPEYPGDTDQQTSQDKCQEDDILTEKQIEHVKEEINARFKLEKL